MGNIRSFGRIVSSKDWSCQNCYSERVRKSVTDLELSKLHDLDFGLTKLRATHTNTKLPAITSTTPNCLLSILDSIFHAFFSGICFRIRTNNNLLKRNCRQAAAPYHGHISIDKLPPTPTTATIPHHNSTSVSPPPRPTLPRFPMGMIPEQ